MFPLIVLTWRLGHLDSKEYESVIPDPTQKKEIFQTMYDLSEGVFFLETCQRIILVVDSNQAWIINDIINRYLSILNLENTSERQPEVFLGIDGLFHLAKVVSGFDSVVLGEDEIQHQFKEAYDNSFSYLGNNLNTYIQYIIRIGKRVRRNIQLDRSSTIEAVESLYKASFQTASSIAVIGTGKMGKLILEYLKPYRNKVSLFTTLPERVGETLIETEIQSLQYLKNPDILISATSKSKFIDDKFLNEHTINLQTLLVDLGMPRNCHSGLYELDELEIVDIEQLVEKADTSNRIQYFGDAMDLIETQVNLIIKEYHHQLRSRIIVDLRSDLSNFALGNKPEFVNESNSKEYKQFVNGLIHISQKHIEKVIFEGAIVND